MRSREVIWPYDRNKWRARRAELSQLTGDHVNVGKPLAAGNGSNSRLSLRMEQKKS
jgi:hypothetical protein